MKPYKAKSLKGAESMVRNLRRRLVECHELLNRFADERRLMAMLAADSPQFFSPADAMAAKHIRDRILSNPKT